jgi:hypothetical protein
VGEKKAQRQKGGLRERVQLDHPDAFGRLGVEVLGVEHNNIRVIDIGSTREEEHREEGEEVKQTFHRVCLDVVLEMKDKKGKEKKKWNARRKGKGKNKRNSHSIREQRR